MEKPIKLFTALASFQQECPAIHKDSKGYGYNYADLPTILEVINPIMAKNKLGFTQLLNDDCIETILFHHPSGESISSKVTIPNDVKLNGMNVFQVTGSAITYYRRYALSAILGIVTDEDTDGNGKKTPQPQQPKKEPMRGNTSKPWITPKQFEQAKERASIEILEKVFDTYQFRNIEQKEELEEIYATLKNQ